MGNTGVGLDLGGEKERAIQDERKDRVGWCKIAIRMSEKVTKSHITIYSPKITMILISLCIHKDSLNENFPPVLTMLPSPPHQVLYII